MIKYDYVDVCVMVEKYPMISGKSWRALRKSFNIKIPNTVTSSYLVQALNLPSEKGVNSNLMLPLKQIGIIDDQGKPTSRAFDWRDDTNYVHVCKEILKEIYPEEITDLLEIGIKKEELKRWFMNNNHVGASSAEKVTSTLIMIYEGSVGLVDKEGEETTSKKSQPSEKKKKPLDTENEVDTKGNEITAQETEKQCGGFSSGVPVDMNVNINININIDSDVQVETVSKIINIVKGRLG